MQRFPKAMTFAVLCAVLAAQVGLCAEVSPPPGRPDVAAVASPSEAADRGREALRFVPFWVPVASVPLVTLKETPPPVPSAVYARIWEPRWQKELGVSEEQKEKLQAIRTEKVAEAQEQSERFRALPPDEQKAQVKAWAGKPAPWRQQLDRQLAQQVEAVLTLQQLQKFKEATFPADAIGLLYNAEVRGKIGYSQEQEDRLRQIAAERLAQFQAASLERAEKLWGLLTPSQQAAMPDLVKHQGPTSAVLSIAWELGFDLDHLVPAYPMLGEKPVRARLGLSAEQERGIQAVVEDAAAQRQAAQQDRISGKTHPSSPAEAWEAEARKRVEAILTPQQVTTLQELDLRRSVVLALTDPKKRQAIELTPQQTADWEQLDQELYRQLHRIDGEMLGKALETLTPLQREQLRAEIDHIGG